MTQVMNQPIYVVAASGKPLMPTRRRNKVWYWLRRGLAKVVSREPFTIQLRFETTEYMQPVTVGVDTAAYRYHGQVDATTPVPPHAAFPQHPLSRCPLCQSPQARWLGAAIAAF